MLPTSYVERIRRRRWQDSVCGERRTASGLKVRLRNYDDWLIFHEIFEEGEYEPGLNELCHRHMKSGTAAHVLDLGGNVGMFALRCADVWRSRSLSLDRLRIVSLEPVSANIEAAAALAELNPTLKLSWTMIRGIAGSRSGGARVIDGPGHFCASVASDSTMAGVLLAFTDLSAVCRDWPEISLLKVDIEGSEVTFFESYSDLLKRTEIVCLETHGSERRHRCVELLAAAGFQNVVTTRIEGEGAAELGSLWAARCAGVAKTPIKQPSLLSSSSPENATPS